MKRIWLVVGVAVATLLVANIVVVATRDSTPASEARGPDGEIVETKDPRARATTTRSPGTAPEPTQTTTGGSSQRGGARAPLDLPFQPPAAGVYLYDTVAAGSVGTETRTQERVDRYTFFAPKRVGNALDQVVRIEQVDGPKENKEATRLRTSRWAATRLLRIKDRSAGDAESTCTYDPPQVQLRFPIEQGDRWAVPSTGCREAERAKPGKSNTSRSIQGEETITIDGTAVRCIVIEETRSDEFESEEGGSGSFEAFTKLWFSPEHRLFVKTSTETTSTFMSGPGGVPQTLTASVESILQRLQPR